MDLFKNFTFTWWQAGMFKLGMLSAGVLLGLYFPKFFKKLKPLLWVVAVVLLLYITVVWFNQ